MIGQPKYSKTDIVSFQYDNKTLAGEIVVVDRYGVFENDSDVHYDILVNGIEEYKSEINPEGGCIYKHIIESDVIGLCT